MSKEARQFPADNDLTSLRISQLLNFINNCDNLDQEQLSSVVIEIGFRFREQVTERQKKLLILFACSTDPKQYNFGMNMINSSVSETEIEKYLTAIYWFAETPASANKSVPQMNATAFMSMFLSRSGFLRPEEIKKIDMQEYFEEMWTKYESFMHEIEQLKQKFLQMR